MVGDKAAEKATKKREEAEWAESEPGKREKVARAEQAAVKADPDFQARAKEWAGAYESKDATIFDAVEFKAKVVAVSGAAAKEESRPILTTIEFRSAPVGDTVEIAAADGFRLYAGALQARGSLAKSIPIPAF